MKTTRLIIIATTMLAMVGCSKNHTVEPQATTISLRGGIVKHTKATETGFAEGDKVGIYIADYTSNNATEGTLASARIANREHTYQSSNTFTPSVGGEIAWTDQNTKITIWGVYPYVTSIADASALPISVKVDQGADGNYLSSDLLLAKKSDNAPSRNAIDLAFYHALSKASITITKDSDNPIDITTGVTVLLKTLVTNATVNIDSGAIAPLTNKANIITALRGGKYEAIVIPQVVSGLALEITLADFMKYTYVFASEFTFAPKSQHDITINLKKGAKVEITSNSISQWLPGTGGVGEAFPF